MNQREHILAHLRHAENTEPICPEQIVERLEWLQSELDLDQYSHDGKSPILTLSNYQQHILRLSLYAAYLRTIQGAQSAYSELCDFIENCKQNWETPLSHGETVSICFMVGLIHDAIGTPATHSQILILEELNFWPEGQYTTQGGDRHAKQ